MNSLERAIHEEISRGGPMSFARFMGLALYSPETGYYETHDRTIGRSGDFFTSVSVGNLFGELISRRIAAWFPRLPDGPLLIVEAGAHRGELADDILTALSQLDPQLAQRCSYCLIEPSLQRQTWQRDRLSSRWGERIQWVRSIQELPPFQGLVVSNELLDAFPVHLLSWSASRRRWLERCVGLRDGALGWEHCDALSLDLEAECAAAGFERSEELLNVLPDEFLIELCPAAHLWWTQMAERLKAGWMLTFDYGATAEELFRPERTEGTLRAYRSHRVSREVLLNPGGQDLTAHVNFTAIRRAGEAAGLVTEALKTQGQFLTEGVAEGVARGETFNWTDGERRQFQTLVHPSHLGRSFRALLQSKSIR